MFQRTEMVASRQFGMAGDISGTANVVSHLGWCPT